MISVRRNDKESGDRLIQRFSNKVKSSRMILLVKSKKYFKKDTSKRRQRSAALMREFYRAKREKQKYYN